MINENFSIFALFYRNVRNIIMVEIIQIIKALVYIFYGRAGIITGILYYQKYKSNFKLNGKYMQHLTKFLERNHGIDMQEVAQWLWFVSCLSLWFVITLTLAHDFVWPGIVSIFNLRDIAGCEAEPVIEEILEGAWLNIKRHWRRLLSWVRNIT